MSNVWKKTPNVPFLFVWDQQMVKERKKAGASSDSSFPPLSHDLCRRSYGSSRNLVWRLRDELRRRIFWAPASWIQDGVFLIKGDYSKMAATILPLLNITSDVSFQSKTRTTVIKEKKRKEKKAWRNMQAGQVWRLRNHVVTVFESFAK